MLWISCAVLVVILTVLSLRLQYKEDIFDFLPQDAEYTESMEVYSSLSEASRIVIIFEGSSPDTIIGAIDTWAEHCPESITEVDFSSVFDRLNFVYDHLPYFLTDEQYRFLDTLYLAPSDTLLSIMKANKQVLSMPGSAFLFPVLALDPLHLVPLSRGIAGQYAGAQSNFDSYNGYMMTKDGHRGFAFYDSPYGSTETGHNAALIDSLNTIAQSVMLAHPTVQVRLLGAPVIAVGNARQIKKDTFIAILSSLVLIIALLIYSFPRKRDILLILLSVSFGWLFGMAILSLFIGNVSVIVLGIGAVLIGIAVNYPLHLLVHQRYTPSVRQTLKEVLSPLITGNITTVGAFVALIPLHSPALRQLGIFASAMFLGTILFCVLVLPHLMSDTPTPVREIHCPPLERWLHRGQTNRKRIGFHVIWMTLFVITGTILLVRHPAMFDANLSHINYMTEEQRADFAWFESLSPVSDEPAYLSSSAREELNRRWQLWQCFWTTHDPKELIAKVRAAGIEVGFTPMAFAPFEQTLNQLNSPKDALSNPKDLAQVWPGRFDTEAMNSHVSLTLTEHFDYIGIICSLIVFIFLCLSFRSLRLGLIAFVPMLLSWVFIFGLMQVFHLQFNLVNVILATFIFGQGDDYTIFVVEGLRNEKLYGKRLLDQFKQSIILSALIMLLSIGVLVFAQHPAMHSLGAVTLIGMSCVLLMAFAVPPLLFRLIK
ncbi:MAG: MMPL family transporter [Paludibacteraceae bacterium]|nr:MMPL family transporter [Paludibacteraceae bacterium]